MCGILAFLSLSKINRAKFVKALNVLNHRGPDSSNYWFSENETFAIGQTRLAITAPNNGTQPITNEDSSIVISVNGEFYDYQKTKKDLESKGHIFKTESDSEIALHLYEEYGLDFVNYLRGEFAIILFDQKRERLVAVRDRFGIKPLCYSFKNKELILSSNSKAILELGIKAEWDIDSFYQVFSHQYLLPDRTMFNNIFQIPPSHLLVYENEQIKFINYWEPSREHYETFIEDENFAIESMEKALLESIDIRNKSDVPVAYYLSGGVDSSLVVAYSKYLNKEKKLPCFSVSFDSNTHDEKYLVQNFAMQHDLDVNFVDISRDDLVEKLPEAVYMSEGLCINGQLVGKYLLSKEVNKHGYKVILSGEGADEAFLGYAHLEVDYYKETGEKILDFNNQKGIMLPSSNENLEEKSYKFLEKTPTWIHSKKQTADILKGFLSNDFINQLEKKDNFETFLNKLSWLEKNNDIPFVYKSSYLWTRSALANYILKTLGDGCEMAHSVEGRLPFLDHIFFNWAYSIPEKLNFRDQLSKYQLRKIALKYMSKESALRPKQPFLAPPILRDLNKNRIDLLNSQIRNESFKQNPFFDYKKVFKFLDNINNINESDCYKFDPIIMTILSISAMQEKYRMS
jgi:asparagine synthase (glutamine-hydrolysing)